MNKQRIEWLLRQVAGDDLKDVPVYIVTFDELRTFEPRLALDWTTAWTGIFADLILSSYLVSKGVWNGRGFAVAIDTDSGDVQTFRELAGVVLHELGHYLSDRKAKPGKCSAEQLRQFSLSELKNCPDDSPVFTGIPATETETKPWDSHEQPFVRAAAHLSHRAGQVFECIRPQHLIFGELYYGEPFSENVWTTALESELQTTKPITEILKTPPPKRFEELYNLATQEK